MTQAALAVDAGQTSTRAALVGNGRGPRSASGPGVVRVGPHAGPERGGGAHPRRGGGARDRFRSRLRRPGSGCRASRPWGRRTCARSRTRSGRALGIDRVAIATDGLTALLGALGPRDGVVVAAGTGTACLGRHGDRYAKVDGWGSLLSDAGSGFAIGRAGLDAALRAYDGRDGGSERLMSAARRRYGTIERMAERIYAEPVPTRAVAAFAADVATEAAAGDEWRAGILHDAARELAISACAAAARLFEPGEPVLVSYAGNVFQASDLVIGPFTRELEERRPGTSVVAPEGDPLAGAVLLAELGFGLPCRAGHPRDVDVTNALERVRGGLVVSVQAARGVAARRGRASRRHRASGGAGRRRRHPHGGTGRGHGDPGGCGRAGDRACEAPRERQRGVHHARSWGTRSPWRRREPISSPWTPRSALGRTGAAVRSSWPRSPPSCRAGSSPTWTG